MAVRIEVPKGSQALREFVAFRDVVYAQRPIRWPAFVPLELDILNGTSPFCEGRTLQPFEAQHDGALVARAVAVVDDRYRRRWGEALGHIVWFEALPGTREAVRALMDAACGWLREHGCEAARCGFGVQEMPFVIDDYSSLPPITVRHNPPYYHALLKDAGFETEKGWVDYRIDVTPELVARWQAALEAGRAAGYEIVPLRDVPEGQRARLFCSLWNETFHDHWGFVPFTGAEFAWLFDLLAPTGMLDVSVIALYRDEPAGILWVVPEMTALALRRPGRAVAPQERLNTLGIGVRRPHRGKGLNLAMASYAYLELARRGARHLGYTMVLDDNWPSRRTGERLGGVVRASYLVYRRMLPR